MHDADMSEANNVPPARLTPRLVVKGAAEAIDFYVAALGAKVLERFEDPNLDGLVVHAALQIGEHVMSLAGEHREWGNHAPPSLGGSPVLLHLDVADADAVGASMEAHGAEVVIPIADQFYGKREGRLRDPFGHLWVVSHPLEKLSDEEIERRMLEFNGGHGCDD